MKASILRLLLGGIWFAVGVGLAGIFVAIGNPLRDHWLSQASETAEGRVTEVTIRRTTRVGGKNLWVVRYRFQAKGRDRNGQSFTTRENLVRGLKKGSRIEVEYLPAKPWVNRARGTRASAFAAMAFLAPGSFVVVGGVLLVCGVGKVFRMRRLLINGRAALGKVTEEKLNRLIGMGKRPPVDVFYTFQDSRGMEWSGRTRVYFPRAATDVGPGQEVKVVYDSLNPKRNFAYELYDIDLSERR